MVWNLLNGVQNISRSSMKIHYKCYDCGSEYKISYNSEDVEDSPQYCPFCSAYIIKDEVDENSENYYVRSDEEYEKDYEEEY